MITIQVYYKMHTYSTVKTTTKFLTGASPEVDILAHMQTLK